MALDEIISWGEYCGTLGAAFRWEDKYESLLLCEIPIYRII